MGDWLPRRLRYLSDLWLFGLSLLKRTVTEVTMIVVKFSKVSILMVLITLSVEPARGIQCYVCYGSPCAKPTKEHIENCTSGAEACFQGSAMLSGESVFGRACAPKMDSKCVSTTCQALAKLPHLKGKKLTDCTGTCCGESLCNDKTIVPTKIAASTNSQPPPTTHSKGHTATVDTFMACALVWLVLVYNKNTP